MTTVHLDRWGIISKKSPRLFPFETTCGLLALPHGDVAATRDMISMAPPSCPIEITCTECLRIEKEGVAETMKTYGGHSE